MFAFLKENLALFDRLLQHIDVPAIADLVVRTVQAQEDSVCGRDLLQWLIERQVIERMVERLAPGETDEVRCLAPAARPPATRGRAWRPHAHRHRRRTRTQHYLWWILCVPVARPRTPMIPRHQTEWSISCRGVLATRRGQRATPTAHTRLPRCSDAILARLHAHMFSGNLSSLSNGCQLLQALFDMRPEEYVSQ